MLKKLFVSVCLLLIGSCSSVDSEGEELESIIIPSSSFEGALINMGIDTDGVVNGVILAKDLDQIIRLTVNDANITSLAGIEEFTGLKKLECQNNLLTTLDLSQNTNLKELNFSNNRITNIDLGQHKELTSLLCSDNELTSLNLSQNILLATLGCTNNKLTNLDLTVNVNLTQLYCSKNILTTLDISKNTILEELFCFENRIIALSVVENKVLKELYCNDNQLEILDVKNANNELLIEFNAKGNMGLDCIQVDNEDLANENQEVYNEWFKDETASYSQNCALP